MKIFNKDKTKELNEAELDMSLGHLVDDKIVSAHHAATEATPAKSIKEQCDALKSAGETVEVIGGKFYHITETFAKGGRNAVRIIDIPAQPAKEAYDDYEDVQVYVPYTEAELQKIADSKRYADLKAELAKIKEDIEQEQFGIIRDDYDQKKARAALIINELRVIEGKEPREILPIVL